MKIIIALLIAMMMLTTTAFAQNVVATVNQVNATSGTMIVATVHVAFSDHFVTDTEISIDPAASVTQTNNTIKDAVATLTNESGQATGLTRANVILFGGAS